MQHSERALTIVQDAAQSARTALTEARWTIENLRMLTADVACPEAMLKEIEHFQAATGIACDCDLAALSNLPETASEQVLRMVREGLTNVARHARAHRVWIQTRENQDRLAIEIGDDGVGFDQALVQGRSGHYGLLGLRERVHLPFLALLMRVSLSPGTRASTTLASAAPADHRPRAERH